MTKYAEIPQHIQDLVDARAEIERLRDELAQWKRAADEGHPQPCTLGPQCPYCEIERLRTELEDQRKDTVCDEQRVADLMADVQRQGKEIERLRGLLREWLEGGEEGADTFEQRVREALGGVT